MSDFTIEKYNESFLRVYSSDFGLEQELSDYFEYEFPGYKFSPKYRSGVWDGKIRLYSIQTKKIRLGLLNLVIKFITDRNYSYEISGDCSSKIQDYSYEEAEEYINSFNIRKNNEQIEIRDFQVESFRYAMKFGRLLVKSSTGSGKSLILYSIIRRIIEDNKKVLLLIPTTTMLVDQMYDDFIDYSKDNGWNVDDNVQKIYSGFSKDISKNITISTVQSVYKLSSDYFNQFDCIIVDEAHKTPSNTITGIFDKATNVKYRLGTTGTIDNKVVHKLTLNGVIGDIYEASNTYDLMQRGLLSKLVIKIISLKYPKDDCDLVKTFSKTIDDRVAKSFESDYNNKWYKLNSNESAYNKELKYVCYHPKRNEFISNIAINSKGNVIILVRFIEHGKLLYDMIKSKTNKPVFYIAGSVESSERESIRKQISSQTESITIGSVQIMSTGVNIPSLSTIIFASPSKSIYQVLQSIGRVLRLEINKSHATLIDISDNLSKTKKPNILFTHMVDRIKIYIKEKFKYDVIELDL